MFRSVLLLILAAMASSSAQSWSDPDSDPREVTEFYLERFLTHRPRKVTFVERTQRVFSGGGELVYRGGGILEVDREQWGVFSVFLRTTEEDRYAVRLRVGPAMRTQATRLVLRGRDFTDDLFFRRLPFWVDEKPGYLTFSPDFDPVTGGAPPHAAGSRLYRTLKILMLDRGHLADSPDFNVRLEFQAMNGNELEAYVVLIHCDQPGG